MEVERSLYVMATALPHDVHIAQPGRRSRSYEGSHVGSPLTWPDAQVLPMSHGTLRRQTATLATAGHWIEHQGLAICPTLPRTGVRQIERGSRTHRR